MTRISKSLYRSSLIALFLTSGVVLAQDQPPVPPQTQPPANGGWRRVGDAPPADPQAAPVTPQTDPTEPMQRSDGYGQPAATMPPQTMPPQTPDQAPPYQASAPANRPAYGLPPELTLRKGTFFTIRTNEPLQSNKNKAGDMFTATLMQPIIANGVVVAQRGQAVAGTVTEVGKDKDGKHFIRLNLSTLTLADGEQATVQTQLTSIQGRTTPGGVEAGTVVATTAVGAAIGGIAARGTGAAIGAGAGALVGLAAVVATHNHPAVIYPETALTFQITSPVTVSTVNSPQAFRFAGSQDYQPAPTLRRGPPAPGYAYPGYGYAAPGYAYPGYAYPPAYYYGPSYPYYWGPGFGVVIGRGWGRRW